MAKRKRLPLEQVDVAEFFVGLEEKLRNVATSSDTAAKALALMDTVRQAREEGDIGDRQLFWHSHEQSRRRPELGRSRPTRC